MEVIFLGFFLFYSFIFYNNFNDVNPIVMAFKMEILRINNNIHNYNNIIAARTCSRIQRPLAALRSPCDYRSTRFA